MWTDASPRQLAIDVGVNNSGNSRNRVWTRARCGIDLAVVVNVVNNVLRSVELGPKYAFPDVTVNRSEVCNSSMCVDIRSEVTNDGLVRDASDLAIRRPKSLRSHLYV